VCSGFADAMLVSGISDARTAWSEAIEGPSFAEPPIPGLELQFLTISGMQYSTGLGAEPNDCRATAGAAGCVAIDHGLLDLTLSSPAGQLV
jgi:hypothetical protein